MTLPEILNKDLTIKEGFPLLDQREMDYIAESQQLFASEFYSYSLLAIWNAAVNNLKRKVECYGVELWNSVVKDETGRKKYDQTGDTIADRWANVDDLILIKGATNLGLLNPKAGKSIEMINWMRNHASPAHDSDNRVEREDAIGLILLLQKNLFAQPLPDPGHSISGLFEPIKKIIIDADDIVVLRDQIKSFKTLDIRTSIGFFNQMVSDGEEPGYSNVKNLYPTLWEIANDDLRKVLGLKYHNLLLNPDSDESSDSGAKTRIFELLVSLNGVNYIPEGTRARIFRKAAERLRSAKNTSYGWSDEEAAAKSINQLGTSIPSVAFEETYQEIIAIWCGNFWGRSGSHSHLQPFFDVLNVDKIRVIISLFINNVRVTDELSQRKPKAEAVALLQSFEEKLTLEAHKQELREAIRFVRDL